MFFGLLCKLHWLNRRILLTYWVRCETGVHLAFQSNTNFRMQLFLDTIFVIFFIVFLPEMMGIAAEITGNNMKDGTLDFVNKIQILFQFFVWDWHVPWLRSKTTHRYEFYIAHQIEFLIVLFAIVIFVFVSSFIVMCVYRLNPITIT